MTDKQANHQATKATKGWQFATSVGARTVCYSCGGDGWSRNYHGTCASCSGSGRAQVPEMNVAPAEATGVAT